MQNVSEKRQGTLGWLAQAVSGVLLLALLGLHMIAHHFIVEGGLRDYQQVLAYLGNPLILVIELVFLVVVTYHAMVGVRSIIFDFGLDPGQERTVTGLLTVVGVVIVVYGFYLAITLFSRA
jgi:succinate dehydrogenase hydrophobic membrane anchor protein